jgi:alkanesulfonate monooxygenase SsuD/methylene tetrahydromethanopterin reductase-like flavin-dependent oxidoreductase (luciferase family)
LAASTSTIFIGSLVARIGLLPDDVLVDELSTLNEISSGRMIAGLGTGDRLSRPENDAFGIPFESAEVRRTRLAAVAVAVGARGIPVWVGGGHASTTELARTIRAAVNLWEAAPERVAALTAAGHHVTWGGPVGVRADEAEARLQKLAEAGATWAVCAWPGSLDLIAELARSMR